MSNLNINSAVDGLKDDTVNAFLTKNGPRDGQVRIVTSAWNKNYISMESLIRDVTKDFINNTFIPHLHEIADERTAEAYRLHDEFFEQLDTALQLENNLRTTAHKKPFPMATRMSGLTAARIVVATGDVRVMRTGTAGYKIITKHYHKTGPLSQAWSGWWTVIDDNDPTNILMKALRLLAPEAEVKDIKQYMSHIHDASECQATQNDSLVFCRNGVWNYDDRTFTEYDDPNFDAKYPTEISLSKLPVYHPLGKAPKGKVALIDANGEVIEPVLSDRGDHTPWYPSSIHEAPFDMDTDVGKAASKISWQTGQSMIRKRNLGDGYYIYKIDWDGNGQNGKTTQTEAEERLVRKPNWEPGDEDLGDQQGRILAARIDELDEPYKLAGSIMTAHAIIGKESDGNVMYIDRAATVKMLSRRQEMQFREPYGKPFNFRFDGLLIQESQKPPIFNEKNDSIISHVICIPYSKSFRDCNKKYIKEDYINRDIVASYFLYKLTVDMPKLDDYDEEAVEILKPYKREMLSAGMTTFQFCDEVLSGIPLTVIPLELLYDLYLRYCELRGITGRGVVSAKTFQDDMEQYARNNDHQVTWTRSRKTVDLDEVNKPCLAMNEFGRTTRLNESDFMQRPAKDGSNFNRSYYLNHRMFTNADGKTSKQFTRGCLVRVVPYSAMQYNNDEALDALKPASSHYTEEGV